MVKTVFPCSQDFTPNYSGILPVLCLSAEVATTIPPRNSRMIRVAHVPQCMAERSKRFLTSGPGVWLRRGVIGKQDALPETSQR